MQIYCKEKLWCIYAPQLTTAFSGLASWRRLAAGFGDYAVEIDQGKEGLDGIGREIECVFLGEFGLECEGVVDAFGEVPQDLVGAFGRKDEFPMDGQGYLMGNGDVNITQVDGDGVTGLQRHDNVLRLFV